MGTSVARIVLLAILLIAGIAACVSIFQQQRAAHLSKKEQGEKREPKEEAVGRVVDVHGFEYVQYRITNSDGMEQTGYRRVIPTTFLFTCPDCGGTVVGVDAKRVRPGGKGPEPSAFRCESCGREEPTDFGVPHVEERTGELSFVEPNKVQPACPQGGAHDWVFEGSLTRLEYPPGVDACTENLIFADEVEYATWHCTKCGEEKEERTIVSSGQSWGRD